MLELKEENVNYVEVNIGRPDLFCDEDRKIYKTLHDFIKYSDCRVVVNNAFNFVDNLIVSNSDYGGGGMKYCFWFITEEDADMFITNVLDIFGLQNSALTIYLLNREIMERYFIRRRRD